MHNRLTIFNEFGITPKVSFDAAGQDFFIPVLDNSNLQNKALNAFEQSYNRTEEELTNLSSHIITELSYIINKQTALQIYVDVLHLFLALDTQLITNKHDDDITKLNNFLDSRFIYEDGKVGMVVCFGDHIKINSGIREALPESTAGVMLNKSGRGTQGFDVRAQVIDSDYSGLVHLSLSYTKKTPSKIFCGDKFVQQLILPIWQVAEFNEVTRDEYDNIMKNSSRGSKGFGSQNDVK